jgi:hypothetical protein
VIVTNYGQGIDRSGRVCLKASHLKRRVGCKVCIYFIALLWLENKNKMLCPARGATKYGKILVKNVCIRPDSQVMESLANMNDFAILHD